MEKQLQLPDHAEPRTLEYYPGGEDSPPWQVDDWRALSEAFSLRQAEVLHWHEALAGQGRPWLVIRRIFHVAPVFGPEAGPDDMRKWSFKELSAAQGVSEARLQADLEAAKEFWQRERLAGSVRAKIKEAAPDEGAAVEVAVKRIDGLPEFSVHQELDEATVMDILGPLRFDHYKSKQDRLYVANRCLELKQFLTDKHQREPTRQLIGLEVTMGAYELTQSQLKARLDEIRRGTTTSEKAGDELVKLSKALQENEKALADLAERHSDLAHKLGADDIEVGERKREALGTISYFADAHRRYYESGDRLLIDGVFTADEVMWLTTPLTIRPAQYRADVVIRAREAMLPDNLWNGRYEPSVVQRDACRRLADLVQGLAEELTPDTIEGVDDAERGTSEEGAPPPEEYRPPLPLAPPPEVEPEPAPELGMVMG